MTQQQLPGRLADIPVDRIRPNPENPRLTFRQGELEELQESIRQYGIQVPLVVYKKGAEYILIDGERRWRCASKLNLKSVPALVQQEPSQLSNLLLMFNIHALREQWDLLTIALKLPTVVALLRRELGRAPTEVELSAKTGLSRSVIRRCRLLMDMPREYQDMLLSELKKPKSKQTLSEDLFIEIEKALKTVMRAMPDLIADKDRARKVLLAKYRGKVVENIVDFRKVGKIARAPAVGVAPAVAREALTRLFAEPSYSVAEAWGETVSEAYAEQDVVTRIDALLTRLDELASAALDEDVREKLSELVAKAQSLLDAGE